ncbi:trehalose-phosphatase [Candidatus Kaiserbacteria bacterium RIFCSPHIGHO2_01_FULL_55_17]|uniref:Trehalose 6-phosphate phosphatase n=1 Tax=Candidatus Kaiserbacteria bacterium RIFCSPHIGHO2_01_FULL_55_17 TaxID=1798484 RepID=A0A1F6D9F6_9BACT|nr:MAG: trehalose-phosphatase [Candidatus Kaiserbacteria bacterium RIFCSPHIGHO2_01_FULL_55_17]
MKDAFKDIAKIRKEIAARGAVVLLDFDGTLAPTVSHPDNAKMGTRMRRALSACARRFPTAVITGRSLTDVIPRVRTPGVSFAGNHGLEWVVKGKHATAVSGATAAFALKRAERSLRAIAKRYHGAWVENKTHSISLHYRKVEGSERPALVRAARRAVRLAGGRHLRIVSGAYVLNVLPNIGRNKGTAAHMLHVRLRATKRAVPIFIGDDVTDEDAFGALRSGITIIVGLRKRTKARYRLQSIRAVEKFLLFLSAL